MDAGPPSPGPKSGPSDPTPPAPDPRMPAPDPGPGPGMPPPGEGCDTTTIPTTADLVCAGGAELVAPSRTPFELEVSADVCVCQDELRCHFEGIATPFFGPPQLHLRTDMCISTVDCDNCVPRPTATCEIPALPTPDGYETDIYRVVINGNEAFDLPVRGTDTNDDGDGSTTTCITPADAARASSACEWPGTELGVTGELCYEHVGNEVVDVLEVTVVDHCAPCFAARGPCGVHVDGSRIVVEPRALVCPPEGGAGCPSICRRSEHTCRVPVLPPGDYELLLSDGSARLPLSTVPGRLTPGACIDVTPG